MSSWGPADDWMSKKFRDLGYGVRDLGVGAFNGWKGSNENLWKTVFGQQSYSDLVKNANAGSDGWYSVLANGIPGVKDLHNALLGRDSAKDYLENNNLSWEDMEGYNDIKLLGRASSGIGGLAQSGSTWLNNIGSDLGKLYSGQKS